MIDRPVHKYTRHSTHALYIHTYIYIYIYLNKRFVAIKGELTSCERTPWQRAEIFTAIDIEGRENENAKRGSITRELSCRHKRRKRVCVDDNGKWSMRARLVSQVARFHRNYFRYIITTSRRREDVKYEKYYREYSFFSRSPFEKAEYWQRQKHVHLISRCSGWDRREEETLGLQTAGVSVLCHSQSAYCRRELLNLSYGVRSSRLEIDCDSWWDARRGHVHVVIKSTYSARWVKIFLFSIMRQIIAYNYRARKCVDYSCYE